MNCCASGLALIERLKATQKWTTDSSRDFYIDGKISLFLIFVTDVYEKKSINSLLINSNNE